MQRQTPFITSELPSISSLTDLQLEDWDESYTLSIPAGGFAELKANTSLGLLRGLETFSQLVYTLPVDDDYTSGGKYLIDLVSVR
jgi:hypothetical protein